MNLRLVQNAAFNIVAGLASAIFAVAVPALLASTLTPIALVVWVVIMQCATYVAPFTLGIQSVVARRVAQREAGPDGETAHAAVGAALRLMGYATLAYLVAFAVIAALLTRIYPEIPQGMAHQAQLAFAVFALGQASLIPLAAIAGYFFGMQDNAPVAVNAVLGRALMAAGIYWASFLQDLLLMSLVATVLAVVANGLLYRRYRRLRASQKVEADGSGPTLRAEVADLTRECIPISVWAIATFAIYGGTSTAASLFDFSHFAAYAVAVAISQVLLGLHSAAFSTLIPHVARTRMAHGSAALAPMLHTTTLVSVAISCTALLGVSLIGDAIVARIVPTMDGGRIMSYLVPLLVGNAVRLIGLPYSNAIVGLGLQSRITGTPLIEAGTTLLAAVLLGLRYGAAGVAWSLCAGGIASIAMHALVNIRATREALPVAAPRMFLWPVAAVAATAASSYWLWR